MTRLREEDEISGTIPVGSQGTDRGGKRVPERVEKVGNASRAGNP